MEVEHVVGVDRGLVALAALLLGRIEVAVALIQGRLLRPERVGREVIEERQRPAIPLEPERLAGLDPLGAALGRRHVPERLVSEQFGGGRKHLEQDHADADRKVARWQAEDEPADAVGEGRKVRLVRKELLADRAQEQERHAEHRPQDDRVAGKVPGGGYADTARRARENGGRQRPKDTEGDGAGQHARHQRHGGAVDALDHAHVSNAQHAEKSENAQNHG